MDHLESDIARWREFIAAGSGVDGHDIDELETHLRDQIGDLASVGLSYEEAFLVAVRRMGALDALAQEFAREHGGRLWRQLLAGRDQPRARDAGGWGWALAFAVAAAAAIQVLRLLAGLPGEDEGWWLRNASLFVLPFVAGYFAHRRGLTVRGWVASAVPFVAAGLVANLFPFPDGSSTEVLVALHLPVVLWFMVAIPYMGGSLRSHERRMDFVRFTGEWSIYMALIALGGGVLLALTALVLAPFGPGLDDAVMGWVLPSGIAGATVIAAWLVESKQRVIENMAPVLTLIFTPLFALMLALSVVAYAVSGAAADFDRDLLGAFDALLVVVLGLVLYATSAREPDRPPGAMDAIQLVAVVSALILDMLVLGSMAQRVGEFGATPNRVAALGLNLVLAVNLAGAAWLSTRFLAGRVPFHRLERWQTTYLPVFAVWTGVVVVVLPPLFAFG